MEKLLAPIPWRRGCLAMILALFVMVVALPNAGKVVVDHTTTPPTLHVEGFFTQGAVIVALALFPVLCILFIGRRWLFAEVAGWLVLLLLVAVAVTN